MCYQKFVHSHASSTQSARCSRLAELQLNFSMYMYQHACTTNPTTATSPGFDQKQKKCVYCIIYGR